jgi:hypothetical protein
MFKWPKAVIILLFQSWRLYGIDLKKCYHGTKRHEYRCWSLYDLSGILKKQQCSNVKWQRKHLIQNSEMMLTDYIKIQVQKAIEDYDLALKQDLVYNQAVEQASENYRIIKTNTITVI